MLCYDPGTDTYRPQAAKIVTAADAAEIYRKAYVSDPVFHHVASLKRMRAKDMIALCRRLGVDPIRPDSSVRASAKKDLIERLLTRLSELKTAQNKTRAGE